ncbi:uncharacterized protein LOC123362584 [Mauremys mutica]|uniref:uncharacterized protein LOC123362584 n=1 Tax=Mauremys mutica TaxID=74926 RepID=UPI001D15F422|nr:uncharacterized protein LOC123362584 [Mauremys mutica]
MSPLGPWVLRDPAWLRVVWVTALGLGSVCIWVLFLVCSLRGRQPVRPGAQPLAGKQSGGGRSQASSEKRRKKGAKQNPAPSRREQPQGARGPLHKEPRTASTRVAAHREELMSAGRKEKSRMAEESSSGSSSSPSPGDTLPWNLAKHQRTKRTKSSSGSGTVLDPAERAVIRIAGRVLVMPMRFLWAEGHSSPPLDVMRDSCCVNSAAGLADHQQPL